MKKNEFKETWAVHETEHLRMSVYHNHSEFCCHWHDEFEFIYVLEGSCSCIIDGFSMLLSEGNLLLIDGGMLHSKNDSPFSHTVSAVIHSYLCGTDCMDYYNGSIAYYQIFRRGEGIGDAVIDSFTSMLTAFDSKFFGYELRIKSLILEIFALILENGYYKPKGKKHLRNQAFEDIISFIHSDIKKNITLDLLEQKFNYSKSYIIRLFKKYTGKTPTRYLNDYRLSKAAELLLSTDMSVTDISIECGFENVGYFIALFRKHFGTPPLKWKNGNQKI